MFEKHGRYVLIKNHTFISTHLKSHNNEDTHLVVRNSEHDCDLAYPFVYALFLDKTLTDLSYPVLDCQFPIPSELFGPYNGLFLAYQEEYNCIYLLNIATRETRALPQCRFVAPHNMTLAMCFITDVDMIHIMMIISWFSCVNFRIRRYGDDKEKVGEKLGLRRQSRAGGWHNKCQARGRKATGKRKNKTDLSSFEMSEDEIGFSNIPRKNIQEKGKKKWVPKPRQTVQREGFGKLIIGEKQGQMGKGVVSDSTLTSIDEGLISDFKRWRGECLRREGQKEGMDGIGHGLVSRDHSQGHQKISFSRSLSLDGPFKDYLENIE
ncbi:hypothetical protein QYF36_003302 [Acer negundo]|nr:hypothetical protein QYF36_003302 [Acer negundo]